MRSKRGFSLMEALIALAIASAVMVGVFAVQHQLVDGQRRHDETLHKAGLQRDALALVKDINPADKPEGQITLPPNLVVNWTSEAVSDDKLTTGLPRGDGNYTATLYALTVTVQDASGRDAITPFKVERVGWITANSVATPAAAPAGAASGRGR